MKTASTILGALAIGMTLAGGVVLRYNHQQDETMRYAVSRAAHSVPGQPMVYGWGKLHYEETPTGAKYRTYKTVKPYHGQALHGDEFVGVPGSPWMATPYLLRHKAV